MTTPPDDITDAELDAMLACAAADSFTTSVVTQAPGGGFVIRDIERSAHHVPRLVAALREARRRLAEHERSFVCWRAT